MHALSHQPWVDRLCREAVAKATPIVWDSLSPWRPRGLFLGGSACLGEAVGWEEVSGDGFVLSDLDLGVVTDGFVPEEVRRSLRQELARSAPLEGPEPTLGFYEVRYQARQAPTLGLIDLVGRGLVLQGDSSCLGRFVAPAPALVPRWEAFRLLGNRSRELLQAGSPSSPDRRRRARAWYAAAKLGTALWTARLVLEGRYQVGWAERSKLLNDEADDPIQATACRWRSLVDRPSAASCPPLAGALISLRTGLVEFFREQGYWPDPPARVAGVAAAYLQEPAAIRDRLRAWRSAGWIWARRAGFRGTPEGRRLAASVLYWLCLPETPEPDWGDGGAADPDRWRTEMTALLAGSVAGGPGARERLAAALARGESR